jgi:SMI1/KNR4 family protein SUKH-1
MAREVRGKGMDIFGSDTDEITEVRTESTGASIDTIYRIQQQLGITFPEDYVQFMQHSNGGTIIPENSSEINLYPIEDLLSHRDTDIELYEGCVFFGSDGGLESYVFDVRTTPICIVEVDAVAGMESAIPTGQTLRELVEYVRHKFDAFDTKPE